MDTSPATSNGLDNERKGSLGCANNHPTITASESNISLLTVNNRGKQQKESATTKNNSRPLDSFLKLSLNPSKKHVIGRTKKEPTILGWPRGKKNRFVTKLSVLFSKGVCELCMGGFGIKTEKKFTNKDKITTTP